jgi:hypothetical protein
MHYGPVWIQCTWIHLGSNWPKNNTVVSNHFHSVKYFLFSSVKPHDFDGMLGTGLPVSMYTTKTPIDKSRFIVTQLKEFFTFSVKDRYQLNYLYINADNYFLKIKFVLFLYLLLSASWKENNYLSWYLSVIRQTVRYRTPVFTQPFSWHLHITITYNLPHLQLYVDVVTVIA